MPDIKGILDAIDELSPEELEEVYRYLVSSGRVPTLAEKARPGQDEAESVTEKSNEEVWREEK